VVEIEDSQWMQKEVDSLKNSSLRLALLAIIRLFQDKGGIYGYKISEKLLEYTQGELDASNATFYAVLRRLEMDSLIESKLQSSDVGPPRKHYYLTSLGFQVQKSLFQHWDRHYYLLSLLREEKLNGGK
jgi:PadR family transcriptional regulator, regulatory protein PadR